MLLSTNLGTAFAAERPPPFCWRSQRVQPERGQWFGGQHRLSHCAPHFLSLNSEPVSTACCALQTRLHQRVWVSQRMVSVHDGSEDGSLVYSGLGSQLLGNVGDHKCTKVPVARSVVRPLPRPHAAQPGLHDGSSGVPPCWQPKSEVVAFGTAILNLVKKSLDCSLFRAFAMFTRKELRRVFKLGTAADRDR
jgi:hypothetical protein